MIAHHSRKPGGEKAFIFPMLGEIKAMHGASQNFAVFLCLAVS
jgi:hypothetical protein